MCPQASWLQQRWAAWAAHQRTDHHTVCPQTWLCRYEYAHSLITAFDGQRGHCHICTFPASFCAGYITTTLHDNRLRQNSVCAALSPDVAGILVAARCITRAKEHPDGIVRVKHQSTEDGESCDTVAMEITTTASPYKRHRYPTEIIGHAVWALFSFFAELSRC